MSEWQTCLDGEFKYRLWPELLWRSQVDHLTLNQGCPFCGHLLALHSESRGCVGCEILRGRLSPDIPCAEVGRVDNKPQTMNDRS